MKKLSFFVLGVLRTCCLQTKYRYHSYRIAFKRHMKLLSSKSITKKDTTDTSPKKGLETLKIYNDTHFTFFTHNTDKSVPATYDSGAGTYTLAGDNYTEHLKYCSEREWENHDFNFTMKVGHDTITQRGVEKVDSGSVHIDHIIIETYVKVK